MWQVVAFTHRGRVRASNEDALAIDSDVRIADMSKPEQFNLQQSFHILMIADGMGGHADGALASHSALNYLTALPLEQFTEPQTCESAINDANDDIYDRMLANPHATGMGTTVVGAALTPTGLLIFNVGDSRAYLHEPGRLMQLSHDDVPPKAVGASHRRASHAITQSLGGTNVRTAITPHIISFPPLAAGETILLCSDGLTDMLDDDAICEALDRCDGLDVGVSELNRLARRSSL